MPLTGISHTRFGHGPTLSPQEGAAGAQIRTKTPPKVSIDTVDPKENVSFSQEARSNESDDSSRVQAILMGMGESSESKRPVVPRALSMVEVAEIHDRKIKEARAQQKKALSAGPNQNRSQKH